ncbi:hypothetical protein K1T71_012437 [Dendrolimus kikuchii]|uniref:Uncharacterized protein n=1 Tax=Dendrolimus kikuchii TaxID=765133 RepID=A0ACC1CJB9_9NEOP|nr:hypothetical protein K1T71_012437 [Dendrolimus kikuchii]
MKINLPLMQLIIRMLILMILFVIIYLISAILYSAKYWPDIYNYINANITIKRIPKISELNITEIDVFTIDPTDIYSTTEPEFEIEISTIDVFDIDEFTNFDKDIRNRRDVPIIDFSNDYSELPKTEVIVEHMDWIDVESNDTINTSNYYIQVNNSNDESKDLIINIDHRGDSTIDLITNTNNNKYFQNNNLHNNYDEENVNHNLADNRTKDVIENTNYITKITEDDKVNNIAIDKTVRSNVMDINENSNNVGNSIDGTDNNEIDKLNNEFDYDNEGSTINDLIDDSKLTTRTEDVEMVTDAYKFADQMKLNNSAKNDAQPFIPWITTIFVVNQTNNYQFDYLCDGILVAENTILTGARCVHRKQTVIDPEDLLIVLGKTSLQTAAEYEKITKIKNVIIHENFTNDNGKVENDLALLVIEEPIAENDGIKVANISDVEDFDVESDEAATTAWSLSGEITPIYFEDDENDLCLNINKVENTICTTYGYDVALCPSYGGIYAAKIDEQWYLQGVFYGDPADRGFCFNKNVIYTSIKNYLTWILDTITSY